VQPPRSLTKGAASPKAPRTIAHPAHNPTSYVEKGCKLFSEHFSEFEYLGRGRWLLPSTSTKGRYYEVVTRGEGSCECLGFERHGHCCHQVAADLARLKSSTCDACGERFLNSQMVEVSEEHVAWSLAFFVGEQVCLECASDHGLL
jgi:hypothetical protein